MASDDENPRQPLINPFISDVSSNIKYTEPLPPTTIDMIPKPTSSKRQKITDYKKQLSEKLKNRHESVKNLFVADLSRRLASRKELQIRLSVLTDIMCAVALLGIILMIIENEITFTQINDRDTPASWSLKLIITISTIILIILVLIYHRLDLTLYAVNNCANDWHVGLTSKRLFLIVLEVIVCAIHPVVGSFPDYSNTAIKNSSLSSTIAAPYSVSYVSLNIALSLPMFLRLYLICRFIIYHSALFHDVGCQSIGYLNQISIDFPFIIKTYFDQSPLRYLATFCIIFWFIGSWSVRACDYNDNNEHLSMLDSMWFFVVTFTTVGYGDILPSTYCGRSMAVVIVFVGLLSSALLIAVVAQKLLLNRWEKYVHSFVLKTDLEKEHKIQAANVIKYTFKLFVWKNNSQPTSTFKYYNLKRKLFNSLNIINNIKQRQRQLDDYCIGLPEIANLEHTTNINTECTVKEIADVELKMKNIEEQLIDVQESIKNIQNTLNLLVDTVKK